MKNILLNGYPAMLSMMGIYVGDGPFRMDSVVEEFLRITNNGATTKDVCIIFEALDYHNPNGVFNIYREMTEAEKKDFDSYQTASKV